MTNKEFNDIFDEPVTTKQLRRVPTARLMQALSQYTYSKRASNQELDELMNKFAKQEEGDFALLTAIVRELQSRLNET